MTTDTTPQDSYDLGNGVLVHAGVLTPELVPVDSITEHPRNPRRGDTDAISESVDENGLYDQIKVQRSTGWILSGNHTHRTLRRKGAERVPVVWLDVDEHDAIKIMTSANATADRGDYDRKLLVELLTDDLAGNTVGTGLYPDDLAVLIRAAEAEDVFTVGADHMLDEFQEISGQTGDPDYAPEYARKVTVFIRDESAIHDFCTRLGIPDPALGKDLNYPLGWVPNDRRKRPEVDDAS